MANLRFTGNFAGPEQLTGTPQNVTGSWADLGQELNVEGARTCVLWSELDINNSQDVRVRALGKHTSGGSEYVFPIKTVAATVVTVRPEYIEFDTDVDQSMALSVALEGAVRTIQWQVQAGTVGATPGQIDSAYVTTGI